MPGVGKSGKGHPKWGGRKAGTPNKVSSAHILQEKLKAVGLDPISGLAALMPDLTPHEQSVVLLGLMPYLFPKKKSIELSPEDEEKLKLIQQMENTPRQKIIDLVVEAKRLGKEEIEIEGEENGMG